MKIEMDEDAAVIMALVFVAIALMLCVTKGCSYMEKTKQVEIGRPASTETK